MLFLLIMVVGGFSLFASLARDTWIRYEVWQIDLHGISTQATVMVSVPCRRGESKIGVRYATQQGDVVVTQPYLCFNEPYSVGQRITIWYRPADPAQIVPAADYRTSALWDFLVGALLVAVIPSGGLVVVWRRRRTRRPHQHMSL